MLKPFQLYCASSVAESIVYGYITKEYEYDVYCEQIADDPNDLFSPVKRDWYIMGDHVATHHAGQATFYPCFRKYFKNKNDWEYMIEHEKGYGAENHRPQENFRFYTSCDWDTLDYLEGMCM